jgi:hypothetical protein
MTLRNALVLLVALVGCSQHPTGASGSACPDWKHYGQRLSCREVIRDDYCLR